MLETSLSNLGEKLNDEYIDEEIIYDDNFEIPEHWQRLAKYSIDKIRIFEKENKNNGNRCEFEVDKDIVKDFGFESIRIYYYRNHEHGFLDSNYIYSVFENDHCLMIDLYKLFEYQEDDIYYGILRELANFKRDSQWLMESEEKYDTEMENMKLFMKSFNNDMLNENIELLNKIPELFDNVKQE